ncbi:DUF2157 domain-containing protein [Flagellimonas hadalis]|uniref:DUF2157 domain-containing protein n=1 Tax=Flagellimonas hadalis TaxID=2597517 RepID=A0A5N5ITL7_9FLAO|nr:DUF2157 domain-containing protein [Allomuricauda hadalis]KAB5488892.1 DUF2157 domain-containing protein [Allomuricauda hadalis]RUA12846.1 MAG: DUF2157 domain-containing protein [Flavobacteriia bacterium]
MPKISREDTQIIIRNSNWSESGVATFLEEHVYSNKPMWRKFLSLLLLGLGISFSTAGIVFFFAYNWAHLHRFAKLGLIEGLVVLVFLCLFLIKARPLVKKTMLVGASVLVGVLWAVFGQVYQTGANAYDFFLVWTLSIAIWSFVSNFSPQWVVFIALINITLILYTEQVARDWNGALLSLLLFAINSLFLLAFLMLPRFTRLKSRPSWFTSLLALTVATIGTVGVSGGIFDKANASFVFLLLSTIVLFGVGIGYGLKTKSLFYLSIIPFGLIIICCAFLLNISDDAGMLFAIGVFIIASITLLIKTLLGLQKKWNT